MLSGATERRTLTSYQSEKMKIIHSSEQKYIYIQLGAVPLRHDGLECEDVLPKKMQDNKIQKPSETTRGEISKKYIFIFFLLFYFILSYINITQGFRYGISTYKGIYNKYINIIYYVGRKSLVMVEQGTNNRLTMFGREIFSFIAAPARTITAPINLN